MIDGSKELGLLCREKWTSVVTIHSDSPYFLGVTFGTEGGKVIVTGEPHMLKDHTDTYSLRIFAFDERLWWPEFVAEEGNRYLSNEWIGRPVMRLFHPPRKVRFFTDEEFDEMLQSRESILMRCEAMEFSAPDNPRARLLITAELSNISIFIDDECESRIEPYFVEYDPGPF